MERTLNREYRLDADEVKLALIEFLEARDLPVGASPKIDFGFSIVGCTISGIEDAQIELNAEQRVR